MPEMRSLHILLGLEWGVCVEVIRTLGVTDMDSFPLTNHQIEEYANYCQGQIKIFIDNLATLSKKNEEELKEDDLQGKTGRQQDSAHKKKRVKVLKKEIEKNKVRRLTKKAIRRSPRKLEKKEPTAEKVPPSPKVIKSAQGIVTPTTTTKCTESLVKEYSCYRESLLLSLSLLEGKCNHHKNLLRLLED
ncbi:hypothetical protein Leryth_013490 [Lithospermum erythrorhizon]|nr:hypothetical protein Leryth_013490 [Lithospermum erythrorhizon]